MSSEEQTIQSWPTPPNSNDMSGMNAEDAKAAIAKNQADSMIEGHPLNPNTLNNPLTKLYVESNLSLHQIAYSDNRTPLEKTMQEGLDEREQRQENRVSEAEEEMAKLGKLGFEVVDIPSDISDEQASCLKMQRLCAEGEYDALQPMLFQSLQSLQVPGDVMAAFSALNQAENLDAGVKSDIVDRIIFWLSDAYKLKATGTK